jgi:PAS domain S-box-containing protein
VNSTGKLSAVRRYGLAVLLTAAAFAVRMAIEPFLGLQSPRLLFLVAVIASARFAGVGPGLLSTLLGGLCGWYSALAHPADVVNLALFAVIGAGISLVSGQSRRSASQITKSEERLRLAEIAAGNSSWEWDIAADRISGSGEFNRQFDIAPGQVLRFADWLKRLHPEDRERVRQAVSDPLHNNVDGSEVEYRVLHKDGSVQWLLGKGAVRLDAAGRPTRAFGIAIDITARKQAEELLRASDELLRTFVKNVPAAVAMLDRELRYLQVSDRWCANFSLESAKMLGRTHYEIFPEIPERWKEVHRRCLAGETLRAEEDYFDRADGSRQWLRWEIRPWGDRGGQPEGILIFSEEITGRKRNEEILRQSEATTRTLLETASQAILKPPHRRSWR